MTIQLLNDSILETSIKSLDVTLRVDELMATLPIDELDATLNISREIADKFRYNTRFSLIDQTKDVGIFYAREVRETGKNSYSLKAVSVIGLLADKSFPGKYFETESGGYYTFRDALYEIIGDDVEYVIEDESEDFDVRGYIGHCSKREAVRHLCMVSGVTAYTKNGVLTFRRAFGSWYTGTEGAEHSYQADEVFNDYSLTEATIYSHYATNVYSFIGADVEKPEDIPGIEYINDPESGEKRYYTREKVRIENPEYPDDRPTNELYVEGEMLITNYGFASSLLNNLHRYYGGGANVEFRVIDEKHRENGVGFCVDDKMIFGYPSEIRYSYGRALVYDRLNSITYSCAGARYENAKNVTIRYINEAGDLLATRTVKKGSELYLTVKHPIITVIVDNRHKVYYKAPERISVYTDEVGAELATVDVVCQVAIIQDGDVIEVYAVDEAYQTEATLNIGGTIYG